MTSLTIQTDVDLSAFNTFGLSSVAKFYCAPSTEDELKAAYDYAEAHGLATLMLGGGSNLLFRSEAFNGLVIHVRLSGIELQEDEEVYSVTASAGENWHQFVRWTIDQGITGLENLSLIPGTVGASPVQNIGAYGVEVGEFIEAVDCYDPVRKECFSLNRDACQFSYRDSVFKGEFRHCAILRVHFIFKKSNPLKLSYGDLQARLDKKCNAGALLDAALVSETVCEIRSEKLPDPEVLGNAGSFFKNPVVTADTYHSLVSQFPNLVAYPQGKGFKLAAGWMIDKLGLKGFAIGGAAVHSKQALVLVNQTGKATSTELFELVFHIREKVKEVYGVSLEVEPITVE